MKRIIAITIFIALLMQTASRLVIIAQFYINRDYIAKNLCVNRNKPQMNCCGRCYLRKKLKQDEKNSNSTSLKNDKFQELAFFVPIRLKIIFIQWLNDKTYYLAREKFYQFQYSSNFFHPPARFIRK